MVPDDPTCVDQAELLLFYRRITARSRRHAASLSGNPRERGDIAGYRPPGRASLAARWPPRRPDDRAGAAKGRPEPAQPATTRDGRITRKAHAADRAHNMRKAGHIPNDPGRTRSGRTGVIPRD